MNKTLVIIAITVVVTLALNSRLRALPGVSQIPEV